MQFHPIGPGEPIERHATTQLSEHERTEIQHRLDRMDRSGTTGPWTAKTLRLIATYPGMVSTALARQLGHERSAFTTNVRKLRELGLIETKAGGHRLSALGRAFTGVPPE